MCGIAGIWADADPEELARVARSMTDAIGYRGPDAEGHWQSGGLVLGHRRLSILDLSESGAQPMHSADGRWVIAAVEGKNDIAVLDTGTNALAFSIPVRGKNPEHAVFSPNGRLVFVSAEEGDAVDILDFAGRKQLAQVAVEDLSIILNLDVVNLCVEAGAGEELPVAGLQIIQPGTIDQLIPHNRAIVLRDNISGDPELFGGAAPLIASDALVRLDISQEAPPAMLVFGSREPERFHHSQATELLTFLARALAELIRIFLGLPE